MTKTTAPWGHWDVLLENNHCKVKQITVLPGHRLSYQTHEKRYETWVITSGTATVTINGTVQTHAVGDALRIPQNTPHRIANTEQDPLIFIEIQQGSYFGEDDIVRLEDDYNRL